jgi:hypothetical protein
VALAEVRARTVSPDGRCIGCPHCGNKVRINGLMDHIEKRWEFFAGALKGLLTVMSIH